MDLSQMAKGRTMKEEGSGDYSPIPEGNYTAQVCQSKIVESGALMVQFEIKAPSHAGRKVASFFDFNHQNQKKRDYDTNKFAEMLQALGFVCLQSNPQAAQAGYQDSSQIRSPQDIERQQRPVNIKIDVDEYNGKVRNQIAFYNRIQGQHANNAQSQGYQQQPQQQQMQGQNWGGQQPMNQGQPYGGQQNVQQPVQQQQQQYNTQGFGQEENIPF